MDLNRRAHARISATAVLMTTALTLLMTIALHHPSHLARILITLAANLSAITVTLSLAATFAPSTDTRQAASHTLDLLLRLVPWYTPRN
ncbi:hypothetical protein [Streptomyces sp. NPDC056983]|uniref:hypothetical protein n=1 Tax=Streptomyces sp. NPDC056983 TaxID=3345987 RepID=UPI003635996A